MYGVPVQSPSSCGTKVRVTYPLEPARAGLPRSLDFAADVKDVCASDDRVCQLMYRAVHVDWLAQSSQWLIVKPLRILLILLIALIALRLIRRLITRATISTAEGTVPTVLRPLKERAPAALRESNGTLFERRRQRAATLGSVLRSMSTAVVFGIAALMVLAELKVNLAPLLASAGIAGVALGFGAQTLVKDVISGMFMIMEDQYGVGDVVDVGEASGTVEAVGLRVTTVRDTRGVLWYIRNGEIIRVGNKSQGWAMVMVDVPVGFGTRIEEATAVMRRAAESLASDEAFATDFIEPPQVLGVEQITVDGAVIRVTAKTTPQAQWRVGRELRQRVTEALDEAGISARLGSRLMVRPNAPDSGTGAPGPI